MKELITVLAFSSAALAQMFPFPGPGASSSAPSGYQHQFSITLGSSSVIPASQTNFTVMVCANLTLGNGNACPTAPNLKSVANGGYAQNGSGYDIVFSTTACSSPTLMKWEMPTYTASSGAVEAWVLNTSLTAGGTFYLCVGNSAVSTFQGGVTGAEWDSYTQAKYHLPNGSTLNLSDSSSSVNNGTNNGATATTGQTDGGAALSGSSQWIGVPASPSLAFTSSFTLSAWFNTTVYGQQGIVCQDTASGTRYLWRIETEYNHTEAEYYNGADFGVSGSTITNDGNWHLAVVTVSGPTMTLYVEGVFQGSTTITGTEGSPNGVIALGALGGVNGGSPSNYLTGSLDEVSLDNTPRSANWIATEYNNQSAPSSFMTVASIY
jgi:hypothetical protein